MRIIPVNILILFVVVVCWRVFQRQFSIAKLRDNIVAVFHIYRWRKKAVIY